MRLMAVDRTALALGLAPGLMLADARARVPDLQVSEHDPRADQDWLERLQAGCVRYTPTVALDAPDGLVLDITGCAHLFGGEAGLVEDIEARMARLGMTLRHAATGTPEAAQALARFQTAPAADEAAAVRRLPIAALRLEEESETALKRAGLKTVGDVASRPMAAIAARFGEDAATAIRRLLGEAESPLAPRRAPPPVMAGPRFAEPVAKTDYVIQVVGEQARGSGRAREERKAGGRRFEVIVFRTDGLARRLRIETGLPTREAGAMMRLFRERIDSLSDPIDPGFGFDLVRLCVPRAEPLAPAQLQLEGGSVSEMEVAALVDRLSTRLGRARLKRFRPRDSHIPEQAQLALPAADAAGQPPAEWPISAPGEPPQRPLHLFDPPQPIEVLAEVPDGPPHRFRWRRNFHEVRRFEGPERIAHEWWRREDGLTRDYYRVEDAHGRRYWIFRHGLYGSEAASPGWYLHGVFA